MEMFTYVVSTYVVIVCTTVVKGNIFYNVDYYFGERATYTNVVVIPDIVPVLKDLFTKRGSTDETVKEFFQRRFGNEVHNIAYVILV